MTREDLEFSITQYLDGTLDEQERAALEGRLKIDAEARSMLEEHRKLTVMLRAQPVPQIQWDRFSRSISEAIDADVEERVARASWVLRAGFGRYAAVAASVLIAAALAVHFLRTPAQVPSIAKTQPQPPQQIALVDVQGPQEDQPAGPGVEEVAIGPGGSYANASSLAPYADEIDTRPSRVALAAAAPSAVEQSSQPSPF